MMKKIFLVSLFAALASSSAVASDFYKEKINTCDEHEMRAALDRATYEKRSVITIIECDDGIVRTTTQPAPKAKPACDTCGCAEPKEEVVKREYFVRETVQKYKPVVKYVPDGTYTRTKPTCNHGC